MQRNIETALQDCLGPSLGRPMSAIGDAQTLRWGGDYRPADWTIFSAFSAKRRRETNALSQKEILAIAA